MMNDELPELAPIAMGLVSLIHPSSFLIHHSSSWVRACQYQPGSLRDAEHQIHVLHGLARRAFDKIVQGHKDNHRVVLRGIADVYEVRALHPVDVRRAVDQANEKFVAIETS